MLFKGKSHLKRQSGITVVTEKLTKKWEQDLPSLKRRIKGHFVGAFKSKDQIIEEEDMQILIEE